MDSLGLLAAGSMKFRGKQYLVSECLYSEGKDTEAELPGRSNHEQSDPWSWTEDGHDDDRGCLTLSLLGVVSESP